MRVQGIYDGEKVVLLEPLPLAPNSPVEVVIPDSPDATEDEYWARLAELGLVTAPATPPTADGDSFNPISIEGEPLSKTIMESRR